MSEKHVNALDGVRGFAVLLVVLYHTGGGAKSHNHVLRLFAALNKNGWTGVTLFFVLSGFLITGILWDTREDPHHLRNFYARRSLRIFPLYYFALTLILVAAVHYGTLQQCLSRLWVYIFYLQNVNLPSLGLTTKAMPSKLITVHFWSLAVEEQFYLLWPALILRAKSLRSAQNLCLGVFVASTVAQVAYALLSQSPLPHNESLWANAGSLALGGYIAIAVKRGRDFSAVAPYVMTVSLVAFAIETQTTNRIRTMLDLVLTSLFWGGLIILSLRPGAFRTIFEAKTLRWIGTISYGMYIYHWLFREYYNDLAWKLYPTAGDSTHQALRFVITFLLTVVISWLSFTYFELPISRFKRYFQAPKPTVSEEVVVDACPENGICAG